MNLAVTKRGIAAFCGVATTVTLCAVLAVFITSVRKPRGSTQYVITSPTKHPTFSPTDSLMPSISIEPSSRPSATPTFSPSSQPSVQPTPWPSLPPSSSTMPTDSPSFEPSSFPSEYPTNIPSQNPTMSASPSTQPSSRPTLSAAPSSWPSLAPSSSTIPTNSPSSEPSSFPSEYPSAKSSFKPSTNPSFSPSNEPTSFPSAVQPRTKTIVITGESGGNMLAMGAVCLILVASTAFYLRRRQNNSNFSNLQCPSDQNDKYPQYGSDAVAPNKPDSVDGAGTLKRSTKNEKNTKVDDVDLEDGRGGTNSVYNKLMAGNINIMAQAIHVPKLLTRQKEKKADDKQSVADSVEVTPKASKPVRVISRLSPMFSPMREFSIKMNEKKRRSLTANYQKSRSMACLGSPPMMQGRSCDSDSADDDEQEQVKKMNGIEESYETKLTNHQRVDAKASSSRHLAGSDSAASCPEPADVSMGGLLQFTYEEELLNSSRADGGFSFRDVYFDPENELYECHVPSGPLGISVGATQLGLRVQNLNPTSPLCKIVSIGDVIVGVDDVDVVGVESSVFWQLVSRRANKHGEILILIPNGSQ